MQLPIITPPAKASTMPSPNPTVNLPFIDKEIWATATDSTYETLPVRGLIAYQPGKRESMLLRRQLFEKAHFRVV